MNINDNIHVLDKIYNLHQEFVSDYTLACDINCAECCTCNVVMTTLEGYHIHKHLNSNNKLEYMEYVTAHLKKKRFQPKVTTNGLADLCIHGKEIPEEDIDPNWGSCLFLKNDQCLIYSVRPFGCRCLISKKKCRDTGYAEMDPLAVTVNNVFMQYIEQIDSSGWSGNLTDVLAHLLLNEENPALNKNTIEKDRISLIQNRRSKVFLIPPEHRKRIQSVVQSLMRIG